MNWFIQSYKEYKTCLRDLMTPQEIAETIHDIDFDALHQNGFRYIFFDVDNTLLPPEDKKISLQIENTLVTIKNKGFYIYFVSNNSSKQRIKRVCDQLNIPGYYFSLKPFPFTALEMQKQLHINLEKTIVVGDQLLTDIIFSNWIKSYGILVDPLNKKLSFIKTLQRELELKLIQWLD